ncbi:hypothetical protein OCU04_001431 [Sclerotinia nivalis]|nr:hypothetical protein OCU04_001431 [Sclerotinia nivalis]
MSMRCVNRVWREKLSNEKVSMSILRVHFRRTWEDIKSLSEEDKKLRLDNFPQFCTRRLKRNRGMYDQVSVYRYPNGSDTEDGRPLFSNEIIFQYHNGRVAMVADSHTSIQVDNLRSGVSIRYMHEQRYPFNHWLLSNQTLVACFDHPKPHLKVWSLDEEVDPNVIRLECRHSILATHNRQVAFLAADNHFRLKGSIIHVWNDGRVQELAEPKFADIWTPYELRICGLVFHPTEESHQFVFYQPFSTFLEPSIPGKTNKVIVQEYIAGVPHKTCHGVIPASYLTGPFILESINDDGLVAILPNLRFETEESTLYSSQPPPHCNHGISVASGPGLASYSFTAFNVFTQEFQNISNHLKAIPVHSGFWEPLFWRGQSIVLCGKSGFESLPGTPDDKPIKGLISASVCDEKRKFRCVRGHGLHDSVKAAAAFCLPFETPLSIRWLAGIRGDDDFIVCNFDEGYVVWRF